MPAALICFTVIDSDQSSDAYSSASSDHESSDTEGMLEYLWPGQWKGVL